MASLRRHPVWTIASLLVVAIGALTIWYVNRNVPQHLFGYWAVDDRTVGVQAVTARDATCWLGGLDETSATVIVEVDCHPQLVLGASTAEGYPANVNVRLTAPLGERRLLDALGLDVGLCAAPRCGMGA